MNGNGDMDRNKDMNRNSSQESNAYVSSLSKILRVIRHTGKEYTFRMSYEGEVKPGQFFEVSVPKYGEAPISVSGIGPGYVDLTIRLYEKGETVIIAGGTGVSPVRGVIEALSLTEDAKDKHVIVGFKSPEDMLFREDLKNWEQRVRLTLTVDGADEGYTGNIGLVTKYIPGLPLKDAGTTKAIVVGPPPMMRFSVMGLLQKVFREENIWVSQERKMCCGLGKCGHCRVGEKYICLDGPVFNYTQSKYMLD